MEENVNTGETRYFDKDRKELTEKEYQDLMKKSGGKAPAKEVTNADSKNTTGR